MQHRLKDCVVCAAIWDCALKLLAQMLRTDPHHIPYEWTRLPQFHFWPPRRQPALLWNLAHLVWYRLQDQRRQSIINFIDFLRISRWKAYQRPQRLQRVGNYLDVL
jgi:hypothetical protein